MRRDVTRENDQGDVARTRGEAWFRLGVLVEGGAVAVGLALSRMMGTPWSDLFGWQWSDWAVGFVSVIPLLGVYMLLDRAPDRWVGTIREPMERFVELGIRHWNWRQVALISLLAGWGEEWLFRGVLLEGIEGKLGTGWALVISSAVFGLFHFVSMAYAVLAAVIGAFLGWIYLETGGLVAPIVAHAVYDFVAIHLLVWRVTRKRRE